MQTAAIRPSRGSIFNRQFVSARRHQPNQGLARHHILLICYDFPYNYAAGVIRTYQFAKELLALGWQPIILTAQSYTESDYNIEISDGALECEKISVPELGFPNMRGSRYWTPHMIGSRSESDEETLTRRFRRFGSGLALPDGKIGWLYPAVKRAREILRTYPVSLCFSVSPRPTAHLVGYRLARSSNIPWVADFALPWSDAYWLTPRPRVIRCLDERLERLVVRSASRITVAYPDLARKLAARFYDDSAPKIDVIPTGFDEDLFASEKFTPPGKFTILYPGNHFCEAGRHGERFLQALDEWLDTESGLSERVEFILMGKPDGELQRQRSLMIHPKVVRLEKIASHRACIHRLLSANLCVVNTVGNRVPSKIYEAMRAGKWILALTSPASDLAAIVRHYPKGIVVAAHDTSAIRQALRDIWQRCQSGSMDATHSEESSLGRYSARYSASLLSHIFDQLLLKRQKTTALPGQYQSSSFR